ncbi:dynein-1-beta heavy chain, flagellar inner arm I1 complex-like [Pecten maximus]|uniref:dynein-1-beta heavy chain, flagellar inner arm I1 complex-like n=1 Tax=Pecten maximus TaxID=6579 RepID=UPI0014586815|nr:dynein-1-beta heavy chain, flagellar inner arm I1 complex-like [Pecten maximus]
MANLNANDISELKSLSAPPQIVKDTLAAAMILLREPNPRDFKTAKKALANINSLKQKLSAVNVDAISKEEAEEARCLLGDITVGKVRSVSSATCGIFNWVQEVLSSVEKRTGSLSTAKDDIKT